MKKSVLFLLLVSVVCGSLLLSGCTQVDADEVAASVMNAYANVNTYTVEVRSVAVKTVAGGDSPRTVRYGENVTGRVNIGKRQSEKDIIQYQSNDLVHMTMIPGMNTRIRQYLYNEWRYSKVDFAEFEDHDHEIWVKLDLGDEQLNMDDRLWTDGNDIGRQIELLNTAREVKVSGTGSMNGTNVYLLDITPDWDVMVDWMAGEPPWNGPRLLDFPDNVKSLSLRMWVAKDTGRLLKTEIHAVYVQVPFDDEESTVDYTTEISFSGHNEPFEVVLPEEAKDAVRGPIS